MKSNIASNIANDVVLSYEPDSATVIDMFYDNPKSQTTVSSAVCLTAACDRQTPVSSLATTDAIPSSCAKRYTGFNSHLPEAGALTVPQEADPLEDPLPALFAATVGGDRKAFARLYRLTNGRLLALALRIVKRRDLAEEVLQDAYVTIWSKASQQTERASPFAWMATVVRHRAIDRLRSQRTGQVTMVELDSEALLELTADPSSVEDIGLLSDGIHECVRRLKAGQRQAILLAYYYGMTHEEISTELDAPLGTVKSWVRRGLLELKDCIDP